MLRVKLAPIVLLASLSSVSCAVGSDETKLASNQRRPVDASVGEDGSDDAAHTDDAAPAGSCPGSCTPGQTDSRPCDVSGTQTRTCDGTCGWGPWGACELGGVCLPGDVDTQPCGNCGAQARTCDATNNWGAFGECGGQGECSPGDVETQSCGNGGTMTRTCAATCTWGPMGPCSGEGVCTPGSTDTQSCGNCGTMTRTCDASDNWGQFGACSDEGACTPGAVQECMCSTWTPTDESACCGQQVCNDRCEWGACGLKQGSECDWQAGTHHRCCAAYPSWQFCLKTCRWSDQCDACSNCVCAGP